MCKGNSLNRGKKNFFPTKIAAFSLKSLKIDGSTAKLCNHSGVEGKGSASTLPSAGRSNRKQDRQEWPRNIIRSDRAMALADPGFL